MDRVFIQVPGSTSNLGSGFDTLGLAVNLYTKVGVERIDGPVNRLGGAIPDEAQPGLMKMLDETVNLFFQSSATKAFGIEVRFSGNVPIARGLGYSATLRVGILAGLKELAGRLLDAKALLNLATQLEGHPDNASPSIFGGFTVSGIVDGEIRCQHFPVSQDLKLVTLVPDFPISTEAARKLMPGSYGNEETLHGLNRAALITAAFASGNLESLRGVFDDRIHQPYREPLIPALQQVIRVGERAGALGGFLSGSGSAIICLALEGAERISAAMQEALPKSQVLILGPDNQGYRVQQAQDSRADGVAGF